MKPRLTTQHVLAATIVAAALLVAGCGNDDTGSSDPLTGEGPSSSGSPTTPPVTGPQSGDEPTDPPVGALSERDLITDDDTEFHDTADWVTRDTFTGDGHAAFSPCAESSFADLGAHAVFQRTFDFESERLETDPSLRLGEIIGEFESNQAARAAYDEIAGWYDDCVPPGADTYTAGPSSPVDIAVAGEALVLSATYGPVDRAIDPHGDQVWFLETGLVVTDDRVAVLTQLVPGQDYNWPDDGTPVERMVPAVAERLG